MKISRLTKCYISVILMVMVAIGFLLLGDGISPKDPTDLIPMAVMIMGAIVTYHQTKSSMKDFLTSVCFFIGLYMVINSAINILTNDDEIFLISLGIGMAGFAIMLLGINLWCGYDYNIVRIRMLSGITVAVIFFIILLYFLEEKDIVDVFERFNRLLLMLLLSASIYAISNEPSLGYSSVSQNTKHNVRAIEMQLIGMNDGYLLKTDADILTDAFMNRVQSPRITLRSKTYGNRDIKLNLSEDGKRLLEIHSPNHTYVNPSSTYIVEEVINHNDRIDLYCSDGQWVRMMILESIPEDFDKAKIFGKEIDITAFVQSRMKKKSIVEDDYDGRMD